MEDEAKMKDIFGEDCPEELNRATKTDSTIKDETVVIINVRRRNRKPRT